LLDFLLPEFEARCQCKVDVIAVGTGHALRLGSAGDVDVVMVHAPKLEEEFVAAGHGVNRRTFMENDFVIVGPNQDPAGIRVEKDAAQALGKIRTGAAPFISRGDESGTHQKEKDLWTALGEEPAGSWYIDAGQGMGAVLTMAGQKQAYTLTDRGTFLSYASKLELEVLVEGDSRLGNPYSIIAVNPEKFDWLQAELAQQLIDWVCSSEGQKRIGAYEVKGTRLFKPTVGK
jgi:tungstate transport system substrate-binding protein